MIWEHRNKEIRGRSIQEAKEKTRQKLEKQVRYFYTVYQDTPFIILRRDRYLFDNELEHHLLLSQEYQSAWLQSVKEAVLVRKQQDDQAASSRKQWFKDFFVKSKKTSSSPSRSAFSTAHPLLRKINRSQGSGPTQAHQTPTEKLRHQAYNTQYRNP
jgi:hypothetical protein